MNAADFRLIAPPHAPFHDDLSLNLDVVAQQARLFQETGVSGVFVSGSTGEGSSLTTAERCRLAEKWIEVAGGMDLEIIVQVGHNSQRDAQEMAAHAQQIGADAVAAAAPCYFKPATVDDLIEFLAPVAAAAGDLPFYYYDIPPLTQVRLPMADFLRRGKPRIPNLVGLKYSNTDLMQMQQCLLLDEGPFEVLYGSDQSLLAGVALGACGAVGTTYNFAAPLYRRLLAALEAGDVAAARAEQARSVQMIEVALGSGGLAAFKAIMSMFGVPCGPVRPPLSNLTAAQADTLQQQLAALGFFDELTRQSTAQSSRHALASGSANIQDKRGLAPG